MSLRLLSPLYVFATTCLILAGEQAVLAQSIALNVQQSGGVPTLDANGNWVWDVIYNTDADGGSAAIELGFVFTDATVVSGSVITTGIGNGDVEIANPAPNVFGWETDGIFGFPEGLQVDPSQGSNGQAFYSFGTGILAGSSSLLLGSFTTEGPTLSGLTSGLQVVGAYDVGGNLVGVLPGTHGGVFDSGGINPVTVAASITAKAGDIDLDGFVGPDDTSVLQTNFDSAVANGWAGGDLTGDDLVDFADVFAFSPTFEGIAVSATTAGSTGDGQVSYAYNPTTGEVTVQTDGNDVGLLRLSSASGAFAGGATLPTGSFGTDTSDLVGVVTNTGDGTVLSGDVSLGNILPAGLTEAFLLNDLELNWSGGFGTPNELADLVIDVPSFIPGDYTGDGAVDNFDLNLLLANWGTAVPPSPAGWDGFQPIGSLIDNDELNTLLPNWGAGGTAIPEPASALLFLAGAAAIRRR